MKTALICAVVAVVALLSCVPTSAHRGGRGGRGGGGGGGKPPRGETRHFEFLCPLAIIEVFTWKQRVI